jgi:ribosomal-protein-serine acetyltransferase
MMTTSGVPAERMVADPLILRRYRATDAAAVWDAIEASRATLQAWVPELATLHTADQVRTGLAGLERAWDERRKLVYAVRGHADDRFIGEVGLYTLDWARSAATLGLWLRDDAQRRGHGTRAMAALVGHALGDLGLHRLDARTQPANARSRRLLERLGFRLIGSAPAIAASEGPGSEVLVYRRASDDAAGAGAPEDGEATSMRPLGTPGSISALAAASGLPHARADGEAAPSPRAQAEEPAEFHRRPWRRPPPPGRMGLPSRRDL